MNCCGQAKQFYNRCCPAPVGVNVNQTFVQLGSDNDSAIDTVTVYGTTSNKVVVPYEMSDVFTPKVYVNGVLQVKGVHYCLPKDKKTVLFKFNLSGSDLVSVTYAHATPLEY